jgi:hypothetical protein
MLLDLKVNELFENPLFITLAGESPMSLYPFDQTGLNPANRISNEAHVVSAINGTDHNYIVPENAPFFKESLVVVNTATGQILEPGVDYTFTHKFGEAEAHMARKLYGSFTFLNPNTTGTFRIAYQTLGGDFVTNFTRAIGNGIAALAGLLTVDWTTLSGLPPTFPVTSHTHPVTGVDGVKQFLDIMALIKEGIIDPNQSLHLDDVVDLDKRFITPLMLGLQDIRATIATSQNANLPWTSISTASSSTDLGAKINGTWFDLPLTVDVPQTTQRKLLRATGKTFTPHERRTKESIFGKYGQKHGRSRGIYQNTPYRKIASKPIQTMAGLWLMLAESHTKKLE